MIRVVVKFKSFSIMIYKTAAAIQKILRMSADAVLFRQCFSAEFAVGLCLVQFDDPLLAILKTGTMLAQFILNFSLRQNKSGGRFSLSARSICSICWASVGMTASRNLAVDQFRPNHFLDLLL